MAKFVEHLQYRVPMHKAEAFATHDQRWQAALAQHPGFIGQMIYRHIDDPEAWLIVVHWRDQTAMESFPKAVQEELDVVGRQFAILERVDCYWEHEG